MTIIPIAFAACNHIYIKRTDDAKCVRCNRTISLQAFERWKNEKDKKKPQR